MSKGHDIKSLTLNLATLMFFIIPFVIYLNPPETTRKYLFAVAGILSIVFLIPPLGFYRPHPYTDWDGNTPFIARKG